MRVQDALNLLNLTGDEFTPEDIKKAYKRACFKFHPDRNPQTGADMMKAINAAYEFLKQIQNERDEPIKTSEDRDAYDYGEELHDILNKLYALNLPDIEIEVCGNWLWVGNTTKEHAPLLNRKEGIGLGWAKAKKKWFYRPSDYTKSSRKEYSMNEIRDMHGSKIFRKYGKAALGGSRKSIAA